MSYYSNAHYRVAYQGYIYYAPQATRLIEPHTAEDPEAQEDVSNLIGYCTLPGWQEAGNYMPVEAIGSMRDLDLIPVRKDCSLSTRILVADGTFLRYFVRNHVEPCGEQQFEEAPTAQCYGGLCYHTIEFGTGSEFCDPWAKQAIDCLPNTLRIEFAEGQPVTATVELEAMCFIDIDEESVQATAVPTAQVLHWKDFQWLGPDSTDYSPLMARVSVAVTNNIQRIGMRQQIGALGAEAAISRTPRALRPGLEKVQLQNQLYDLPPASFANSNNWGTLHLRAEEVGTGAGRQYLDIAISYAYLTRLSGGQAQAGQPITFAADNASRVIAITSGLTT